MKTEIKVTAMDHDELVDIFSTAFYANNDVFITWDDDDEEYLRDKGAIKVDSCVEDVLAELVLNGKSFEIVDYNQCSYDESTDNVIYGHGKTSAGRWVEEKDFPEHRYDLSSPTKLAAVYTITLDGILKAASTEDGYKYASDTIEGEGDFYDAWSFIQIVMFGEVIYG